MRPASRCDRPAWAGRDQLEAAGHPRGVARRGGLCESCTGPPSRLCRVWAERAIWLAVHRGPPQNPRRPGQPHAETDRGHGRIEQRSIQVAATSAEQVRLPYAAQAFCIVRETFKLDGAVRSCEAAYGLTSLTPKKADRERLAELARGQWEIENRLHWVRDVTFDKTARKSASGSAHG
jgi:predicted transposase YbfD/YdcC